MGFLPQSTFSFGMLSFHAHAQASPCHTTRNQWVVQVPYAIGYAPGTADWTPVSAPIQSTGADFYSCDGGNDAWRSIGFVEMDNPVGTVVGKTVRRGTSTKPRLKASATRSGSASSSTVVRMPCGILTAPARWTATSHAVSATPHRILLLPAPQPIKCSSG